MNKAQDTLIIWSQLPSGKFRFEGSRSESLERFKEHLNRIDPDCYRVNQLVSSPEGNAYEIQILPSQKGAFKVA